MHFLLPKNRENISDMQLKQVNDLYFQHNLYFQRLFSDFTMSKRIYRSKFQKISLSVALDESEDHEKNIEGIPDYEMPKSFADESIRLIDNDKNDNKSDSGQNSVENIYVYIYIYIYITLSKSFVISKAAARNIRNLLNTKSFSKMEKMLTCR